jgi:hypothetical protein
MVDLHSCLALTAGADQYISESLTLAQNNGSITELLESHRVASAFALHSGSGSKGVSASEMYSQTADRAFFNVSGDFSQHSLS